MDYSFHRNWFAGSPKIYLKKNGVAETNADWNLRVHLNGTKESYLEYATLYLFANQFYLSMHAIQYSCGRPVSSKTEFDELLNGQLRLGPDSMKKACGLDFFPKVQVNQDTVEVSFCTFSGRGGLVLRTLVIQKDFPHRILDRTEKTLIDYDCGIII